MDINYNESTDLLYIRLDGKQQKVINKLVAEDIVLDVNKDDKLVGIEILNASRRIKMENLFPLKYKISKKAVL